MSNRAVPRGAAVHAAARKGDDAVVRALLDAGADKDLKVNGCTPLYFAATKGYDTVVRTLLDAGADKDLANNDGATSLYTAAHRGYDAVVRALLDAGAECSYWAIFLALLDATSSAYAST